MHFGDFLEGGSGPCCMEVSAARPLGKTNYLHFPRGLQRHKFMEQVQTSLWLLVSADNITSDRWAFHSFANNGQMPVVSTMRDL